MTESKTCKACGETKPVSEFNKHPRTKNGLQSYCRCCQQVYNKQRSMRRPFYKIARNARDRAEKSGVPFGLTEEYLESIWTGSCPVFGIRLRLPGHGGQERDSAKPSLDRLVPAKGYVPGNVIWISLRANQMKNDGTSEELFRVAEWLKQTEEEIKKHEAD